MSLKVREQFPEFEINEFTAERELTLEDTLNAIKQFNWEEEYVKSSKIVEEHAEPSICLTNHLGDKLSMYWAEDGKFAVFYAPKKWTVRSNASIVKGFDQLFSLVKLFNKAERKLLLENLKTSEYHHQTPWIFDVIEFFFAKGKTRASREMVKEEYVYEIRKSTILKKLLFSILFIVMTPVIWIYGSVMDNTPFKLIPFLILQAFTSLIALPGILIAVNHWRKNGQWKVYFRKGENIFFIVSPAGKEQLDKGDFTKRLTTVNDSNAPWNDFEYTTLIKKNGEQIHFSNLLIPTSEMDKLFGRLEEIRDKSGFQVIKTKEFKE